MDQLVVQSNVKLGGRQESVMNRNLINGFYATGLHRFNFGKVLNKIPFGTQNAGPIIQDTFMLSENRYGQNVQRIQSKIEINNIEQGKSVG